MSNRRYSDPDSPCLPQLHRLRNQIISGDIPEVQLRQNTIAAQYRVSRIPVAKRYVNWNPRPSSTIVPNRGALVPELLPRRYRGAVFIQGAAGTRVLKSQSPYLTDAVLSEAEAVLGKFESDLRKEEHIGNWPAELALLLYSGANRRPTHVDYSQRGRSQTENATPFCSSA